MCLFRLRCYCDSITSLLPVLCFKNLFLRLSVCPCVFTQSVVNIQHLIGCFSLFGCVFLVWRHHLRKVSKSLVSSFRRFFIQFSYCLMFLNIQIDLIILKTFNQQFTLTTKKSLHIIFKLFISFQTMNKYILTDNEKVLRICYSA